MILDDILATKHREVEALLASRGEAEIECAARAVEAPPRGLAQALRTGPAPRVLAEVKRRSPSKGEIRSDFDPGACALAYVEGGAAAISVLTDERYFGGHLSFLSKIRALVGVPLLRKDFTLHPVQIDEARAAGADAILLIVAALSQADLASLAGRARHWGLDAIVEVHDEEELERALDAGARIVGINNRNLRTFETDLGVTERLAPRIPDGVVVVAESGIATPEDVARLQAVGAHAFLVGESLMRQTDLVAALRELRGAA